MENTTKHQGKIIDQLRKDRKVSRQDLVEGIMSIRNFQRYASGETSIPIEKLNQLLDRLNMDNYIFNSYINEKTNSNYSKLIEARKLAVRFKIAESKLLLATVDYDRLEKSFHKFLYNATSIILDRSLDGNDTPEFYLKLEKLINFPDILEYKTVNLTEFNILVLLNKKYYMQNDRRIIDFLYSNISKRSYVLHSKDDIGVNICYSSLAGGLYRLGEYEECINICDEGIVHIKSKHFITGLDNLLGYRALALEKMMRHDEAVNAAIKLYMYLYSIGNEKHREIYISSLERNLNIKFKDIIKLKGEL